MKFRTAPNNGGGQDPVPPEIQQYAPKPPAPSVREIMGQALPHIISKIADKMNAQTSDEVERAQAICADLDLFMEETQAIVDRFKDERTSNAESFRSQVAALTDNMRAMAEIQTTRMLEFCDQSEAALQTMLHARSSFERHYPPSEARQVDVLPALEQQLSDLKEVVKGSDG